MYEESLPLDDQGIDALETLVKALPAPQLVIIDPITAFLPPKMDIHRANDVRSSSSGTWRKAERAKPSTRVSGR